ncbi:hypothetical protein AVEN_52620-1 [Araneus ventricosus]|uniref:Uncharacterized protein n=1 Tax=Araneus ventricosus TaxID=182803 RepID=A0A4Y2ER58_ARAVE|nr:hypothetical protein AVEN_52620-1 [Araneus ventricosus]
MAFCVPRAAIQDAGHCGAFELIVTIYKSSEGREKENGGRNIRRNLRVRESYSEIGYCQQIKKKDGEISDRIEKKVHYLFFGSE